MRSQIAARHAAQQAKRQRSERKGSADRASRQRDDSLFSIIFERPSAGLRDPDTADSLPAGLDLPPCCWESGTDEAH
jgi:hypothetical protein